MQRFDDPTDLRRELRFAADRQLQLFSRPNEEDEMRFPVLARISESLRPREWSSNRSAALRSVVRAAVEDLPESSADDLTATWRELAGVLYGFTALPPDADGNRFDYNRLTGYAKKMSGFRGSRATWGRRTNTLRGILAEKLLEMESAASTGSSPTPSPPTSLYVERPRLVADFDVAVGSARSGVVCLVGSRGCGKSTFAQEAALRLSDRDVLLLEAGEEQTLRDALAREVGKRGLPVSGVDGDPIGAFRAFLQARAADLPPVVLLDDVADWGTVERVVKSALSTLVIITSNSGDLGIPVPHRIVEVGCLDEEEAFQMARLLIVADHATDGQCRELAEEVGRLPLALAHSSVLISEGWLRPGEFIEQLRLSASTTFEAETSMGHRSLTVIHRHLMALLEERHPEAMDLLAVTTVLHHANLAMNLAAHTHAAYRQRRGDDSSRMTDRFAFARALSTLRRMRIVKSFQDMWTVHSLTQAITKDLLGLDTGQALNKCAAQALSAMSGHVLVGQAVTGVTFREYEDLYRAIPGITSISPEEAARIRIGRAVNALCKQTRLQGTPEDIGVGWIMRHVLTALKRGNALTALQEPDSLELISTYLRQRLESGDISPAAYASQLGPIAGRASQLSDSHGYEYFLWARLVRIETCLLLHEADRAVEYVPPLLDELRRMELAEGQREPWLAEVFLLLSRAEEQCGAWQNAATVCDWARKKFVNAEQNAAHSVGAVVALAGLARAAARIDAEYLDAVLDELNWRCHGQHPMEWPFDEAFDPHIPAGTMALTNMTTQSCRITQAVRRCAEAPSTRGFTAAHAERLSQINGNVFDLLPVEERYDRIRYGAALAEDLRPFLAKSSALVDTVLDSIGRDPVAACKALLLHVRVLFLSEISNPGRQASATVRYLGAAMAVVRHLSLPASLRQDSEAIGYCILRCLARRAAETDSSVEEDLSPLPLLAEDGTVVVPASLDDIFRAGGAGAEPVLDWYARVAEGAVRPLGILAF
ncbi:ATP-binding protein [Streptomyces sp. NPDC001868]|uniref:ATP-binding protein n=1 Tax=Streptomyces sp. NPDC001868 TaxID=3154401 RepID=UPI0033292C5A